MSLDTRTGYWFTTIINGFICSIICIFLLSIHIYKYCKNEILSRPNSKLKKLPLHKLTSILSLIAVNAFTLPVIFATMLVAIDAIFSTQLYCDDIQLKIITGMYQLGKTFMYSVFVLRLYSVYDNTAYAFNKYILSICGSLVVIISLSISISAIYVATPTKYQHKIFNKIKIQCTGTYPHYQLALFAMNEIIVITVLLYAFISPLRKMLKASKLSDHNYARKKVANSFKFVAIKTSILTLFAMCSSFLSMIIIGTTKSTTIAAEDMIINSICIMLMYTYYSEWYYKCCYCCIKCCEYCQSTNQLEVNSSGQIKHQQAIIEITTTNKSEEREGSGDTQESNPFNQSMTIQNLSV
eukprot:124517_1